MPEQRPPKKMGRRRAIYKPNHSLEDGIGGLMRSEQMRRPTAAAAKDIAQLAAAFTPRSAGPGPHLADAFEVEREAGLMKVSGNLRVQVNVVNKMRYAAAVEFGQGESDGRRMLGRAGAVIGEFKPTGGLDA